MKRALIIGLILGIVSVIITWIIVSETSPFYENELVGTEPTLGGAWKVWGIMNIPGFMALSMSRSVAFGLVVVFIQWSLIGFSISRIIGRIGSWRKK